MSSRADQPKIPVSIVVIGIHTAKTIGACLQSIQDCRYPRELLEVIYVDGGSDDQSVSIARQFSNVRIIELVQQRPTASRGRNAGWKAAKYEIIQFLDSDTLLDKDWFVRSLQHLNGDVVAVVGERREVEPRKNWFHLISDIELYTAAGDCKTFGGDVLIKKDVLDKAGGYDEELPAGEDPDLSYRLRKEGWNIRSLPFPMCRHDIQMETFAAYVRRSARTGWASAALAWKHRHEKEKFRMKRCARIVLSVIVPWGVFKAGIFLGYPMIGFAAGLALALRSLRKVPSFRKRYGLTLTEAVKYALHLSFVVYPQFVGILRFILQKVWKSAA